MVHGAHEMHVEDEWHAASFAKAAIGKADTISLHILSGCGLMGVGGHDRSPKVDEKFSTLSPRPMLRLLEQRAVLARRRPPVGRRHIVDSGAEFSCGVPAPAGVVEHAPSQSDL